MVICVRKSNNERGLRVYYTLINHFCEYVTIFFEYNFKDTYRIINEKIMSDLSNFISILNEYFVLEKF